LGLNWSATPSVRHRGLANVEIGGERGKATTTWVELTPLRAFCVRAGNGAFQKPLHDGKPMRAEIFVV
jgi:hypothetical protein